MNPKKMKNKFYITTSIMYANGSPHVGFALELLQADFLARYNRLLGNDTWFLTGTDEHGTTVIKAANKAGKSPKEFVDAISARVLDLTKELNISNDDFIRTSDQVRHWPTAKKFWGLIGDDLYKKNYEGLYCVGHEAFIKKSDLVDGLCPLHKTEPEKIEEENWFFKLTKYKKQVKDLIESGELKIVPESRKSEILNIIEDAEDVSFSRIMKDSDWGIPVPGDSTQTMYVWADALTNYISALYSADGGDKFRKFWPADVHLVGKDIFRFHAMIWPAMLLSAEMPLPKAIYVHGFINVDGQKMSKTIGNVIDPFELIKKYGVEVTRYFLLREIPSGEDGNFSYKKLEERYNGDLANGLGNLVQRVITLIESKLGGELIFNKDILGKEVNENVDESFKRYRENIDRFALHEAIGNVWELISFGDKYMDDKKPWAAIKHDEAEFLRIMTNLVHVLYNVAWMLLPFMPETADKIFEALGADKNAKTLGGYKFLVKKIPPLHKASEGKGGGLFPRLN